MGSIIKMIGTLLAGVGLSSFIPNADLNAPADASADVQSSWMSVIAIGGVATGMLIFWILKKCKVL